MFDLQTELYLRRTQPREAGLQPRPVILGAIAGNLALWVTVLLAAL